MLTSLIAGSRQWAVLQSAYVYQETSYEQFHEHVDRIYRPTHLIQGQNDFEIHFARVPVNFINELPEAIPEVEKLIRFQNKEQKYIRVGEERFKPEYAYVTDQEVFEVFSFSFLEGFSKTALKNPYSVVLTESTARKYFGHTQVVGEEILVSGDWSAEEQSYHVTGVMQDLRVNTHLPVDMLFSFANEEERTGWAYIYALLRPGTTIEEVEAKIPGFIADHTDPESPNRISFVFQPLRNIHLHSNLAREITPNGQELYVKIFFWVGFIIWLIALINFSNLSTALAMGRSKEMGMRKILGAGRLQLMMFSIIEAVIQSLVALALGLVAALLLFPAFSQLTNVSIFPPKIYFVPALVGLALMTGILAGILPAALLASVKILQTLRMGSQWSMRQKVRGLNIRRGMVTLQFGAALMLLAGALVGYQQFQFIRKTNLGLKSEQILTLAEVPSAVTQEYATLKNRLLQIPGVKNATACMQLPSTEIRDVGPVNVRGSDTNGQDPMMDIQIIDPDFMQMMELEILAGEDFTKNIPLGSYPDFAKDLTPQQYLSETPRKYFINETAMHQLGWQTADQALGKEINWSIGNFVLAHGPVAGVIKDYHQESLKNKVDPLVLTLEPMWWSNIMLQLDTDRLPQTIASIEKVWNDMFPYAFDYSFLDDSFAQLYAQDEVQMHLVSILTGIAILIAFLGLISMVAFALRSRAKELAIRRVIGATIFSLVKLIGWEYLWVLLFATLIALPISYYGVSQWLQNFAYRTEISPWIYSGAVLSIFALLVTTIYLQTFKATVENPMESLRE